MDLRADLPLSSWVEVTESCERAWPAEHEGRHRTQNGQIGENQSHIAAATTERQQETTHQLPHWMNSRDFYRVESERRKVNGSEGNLEKVFLSHSWREQATQEKKRRIVGHLSKPAKVQWAW